jgi:putative inorganic carbon (hco3(-)) transporter
MAKKLLPVTIAELYTCRPTFIWQYVKSQPLSLWCICGYLFFEYVRPQSIYTWLDFFPWASSFVIAALGLSFFSKDKMPKFNILDKLILTYGIVVLLSALSAYEKNLALSKLSAFTNWLIIYYAIIRTVNTDKRFFIFLLLYLLCNFKMSQHGFISWASRGFSFAGWGVTGSPGWFQNSGEFGIQLTIFTPLAFAFIFALRTSWTKPLKIFFYLFPITAIGSTIATSSRGALLGLIGAGIWSLKTSKYFFRTVLLTVTIGTAVFFLVPAEFKARFESAGDDGTSIHRLDRWKQGWEAMLAHPVLGVGHKNWEWYFSRYGDKSVHPGTPMVHNIFIESGTEHGFIGLFSLILIFVTMFRLNKKIRTANKAHPDRFHYLMAYGMDGAVIGLIISASFVTVLYYPYIWIHAAFISCLYNVSGAAARRTRATQKTEEVPA